MAARKASSVKRRGVGRPSKLTDDVANTIVEALEQGGYAETAAAAAGVGKSTFYDWYKRGDSAGRRSEDAPFRAFRARVDAARAAGEQHAVELVRAAAVGDWRAAAWLLERQFPHRWAGPRGRSGIGAVHPVELTAGGETSSRSDVADDQVGPDGSPL